MSTNINAVNNIHQLSVSTAQAAAARNGGYLNQSSYTVRVPGQSGNQTNYPTSHSPQSSIGSYSSQQHDIVTVKPHQGFQSEIEQALIHAKQPLENLSGRETINTGPYRGVYLNKHEVDAWRGPIPIDQYRLNDDPNPEVIRKRLDKVRYTQEMGVRYLNPPPPPKHGDLIIRERQSTMPLAPPLIVRQEGQRSSTPPPIIYREAPPCPPPRLPEQVN